MRHRDALRRLAERGDPRGADRVLHAARTEEASPISSRPSRGQRDVAVALAEPTPPRRAWFAVAAFLVVVLVGGVVVWALRPGEPDTTGPTPIATTPAPTSTTAATAPEALGLVPRDGWADPALEPVFRLPPCADLAELAAFMATEFPEAAGHDFDPVEPQQMATVIPMPRVGYLSLFTAEDLDGGCFSAGRRGDIVGWWFGRVEGGLIARVAARDVGIVEVPIEASQGPYYQSRTASMHNFTGSVYPDGRAQVVVGPSWPGRYAVFEVPGRVPADATGGDHLAASLAARPFHLGRLFNVSLLPGLLPADYGPCVAEPFFLAPGSNELIVYCTPDGDHVEVHGPEWAEAGPEVPGTAEVVPVGIVDGRSWETEGRRFVVVELVRSRAPGAATLTVWASGPSHLRPGMLEAILSSTVALRPDTLAPRRGGGDLREVVDDDWLRRVVTAAGAMVVDPPQGAGPTDAPSAAPFRLGDDVDVSVNTFTDTDATEWVPGDQAEWAILLQATDVVGVGTVDVLVSEDDNGMRAWFVCGRVAFDVSFDDSSERPSLLDPDWSRDPDRRGRILGFLGLLVDEIGCSA